MLSDQALRLRAGQSRLGRLAAVEHGARAGADHAVGAHLVLALEGLDRLQQRRVVERSRGPASAATLRRWRSSATSGCSMPGLSTGPSGGQLHGGLGDRLGRLRAGADLQQGLAQPLELLVLGMQAVQIVAGRLGGRHRLQHDLGIAQASASGRSCGSSAGIEAAAAGVARILQDGEAELDLGGGQRRRRGRHPAPGAAARMPPAKPPIVGLGDLGHRVARAPSAPAPSPTAAPLRRHRTPPARRCRRGRSPPRSSANALAHLGEQRVDRRHGLLVGRLRGRRPARARRPRPDRLAAKKIRAAVPASGTVGHALRRHLSPSNKNRRSSAEISDWPGIATQSLAATTAESMAREQHGRNTSPRGGERRQYAAANQWRLPRCKCNIRCDLNLSDVKYCCFYLQDAKVSHAEGSIAVN